MALLDRINRLIKANINDLADRAENPEKLLRQLLLDMENQRIQVKTQVAIAVADWHVLEKKKNENLSAQAEWMRKAELALSKGDEKLARTALERSIPLETAAQNLAQQMDDQSYRVETLKTALAQLESKLSESRAQTDVLIARYRRARAAQRAASTLTTAEPADSTVSRLSSQILDAEAKTYGGRMVLEMDDAVRLEEMDRADKVDQLLAGLRAKIGK